MPRTQPAPIDEILAAQDHARAAAEANQHLRTCPYRPTDSSDEHGRFLQLVWTRAYRETQALLRAADTQTLPGDEGGQLAPTPPVTRAPNPIRTGR